MFPAIRGKMGSTEFFQVTMTAKELAGVAGPASELTEWKQWTIGERFQRDVAVQRIREELVPYLLRSRDRFFGSLIVLVYKPSRFEFEPLSIANARVGAPYRDAAARMGFLTVDGGKLVALDGQHRLVALREIINGGATHDPKASEAVAGDEVCVVFVRHESLEKTRRIFNKVNRHARPTTPTDNIITSEDDGYAIVARWLVESDPPLGLRQPHPPLALFDSAGEPIVEWRKTNLDQFTTKLTTLQALYQTVEAVCDAHGLHQLDEKHQVNRPPNEQLEKAYRWSAKWWREVLEGFDAYRVATASPTRIREMRQYREKWSLLFRPVAQVALFQGLGRMVDAGLDLDEAVRRTNRLNWRASADMWTDTIIRSNGKMVATQQGIRLTGRLIAYLAAADAMKPDEIDRLQRDYATARGWSPYSRTMPKLPAPKRPI